MSARWIADFGGESKAYLTVDTDIKPDLMFVDTPDRCNSDAVVSDGCDLIVHSPRYICYASRKRDRFPVVRVRRRTVPTDAEGAMAVGIEGNQIVDMAVLSHTPECTRILVGCCGVDRDSESSLCVLEITDEGPRDHIRVIVRIRSYLQELAPRGDEPADQDYALVRFFVDVVNQVAVVQLHERRQNQFCLVQISLVDLHALPKRGSSLSQLVERQRRNRKANICRLQRSYAVMTIADSGTYLALASWGHDGHIEIRNAKTLEFLCGWSVRGEAVSSLFFSNLDSQFLIVGTHQGRTYTIWHLLGGGDPGEKPHSVVAIQRLRFVSSGSGGLLPAPAHCRAELLHVCRLIAVISTDPRRSLCTFLHYGIDNDSGLVLFDTATHVQLARPSGVSDKPPPYCRAFCASIGARRNCRLHMLSPHASREEESRWMQNGTVRLFLLTEDDVCVKRARLDRIWPNIRKHAIRESQKMAPARRMGALMLRDDDDDDDDDEEAEEEEEEEEDGESTDVSENDDDIMEVVDHPDLVVERVAGAMMAAEGAHNVSSYHENVLHGMLPPPEAFTFEGLLSEYFFKTGCDETDQLIHATYSIAQCPNPVSGEVDRYVGIGMNSSEDGKNHRDPLNLVIVLDISGSMGSHFQRRRGFGSDEPEAGETANDAPRTSRTKMDVAKEVLVDLLDILTEKERLGIILFDTVVDALQPFRDMSLIDTEELAVRIREDVRARGGTNMEIALRAATEMLADHRRAQGENPVGAKNYRIVFLTDAQPNSGGGPNSLVGLTKSASDQEIYTTYIGIGLDFNSDLTDQLTKFRGTNYFAVHSRREFQKILTEDFNYIVTELAHDTTITLESSKFAIDAVYGSPYPVVDNVIKVGTISASSVDSRGLKGGLVLVKLAEVGQQKRKKEVVEEEGEQQENGGVGEESGAAAAAAAVDSSLPSLLSMSLKYELPSGEREEQVCQVDFDARIEGLLEEGRIYEHEGIRKAVLLAQYGTIIREMLQNARANRLEWLPQEDIDRLKEFKTYFEAEAGILEDKGLVKELDTMDRLIYRKTD